MTFANYWHKKCNANPQLKDGKIKMTMSASSLMNELRKAYEAGAKDKAEIAKELKKGSGVGWLDGLFN